MFVSHSIKCFEEEIRDSIVQDCFCERFNSFQDEKDPSEELRRGVETWRGMEMCATNEPVQWWFNLVKSTTKNVLSAQASVEIPIGRPPNSVWGLRFPNRICA